MPRALHRFTQGQWKAIIGEDIQPAPPPVVTTVPTIAGVGTYYSNDIGGVSPQWPAGHQAGDIGIMTVVTSAQTLGAMPSGWAHVTGSPVSTGTGGAAGSVGLNVLWKRATSSSESAFTVGDSGSFQIARIVIVRGCVLTGNPWDVVSSDVLATAATAFSIPGFTTTVNNCLCLAIVANGTDSNIDQTTFTSNTHLLDFTEWADANTSKGTGGGAGLGAGGKGDFGVVAAVTGSLATSSKQARFMIAFKPEAGTAPPPTTSGLRTFLCSWKLRDSRWGTSPTPDTIFATTNGDDVVKVGGWLDLMIAATSAYAGGGALLLKATGGNPLTMASSDPASPQYDPTVAAGRFSRALWKALWDDFVAEVQAGRGGTGEAFLRTAVRNGNYRANMFGDDIQTAGGPNSYSAPLTYEDIEDCCAYAKSIWPWMPQVARVVPSWLKQVATSGGVVRRYRYLDAGWAQFRYRDVAHGGALPPQYFANEVADGEACGLATLGGCNGTDMGSGTDPAWGCIAGSRPTFCSFSPNEIRTAGYAAIANQKIVGFSIYSDGFSPDWWINSLIQSAMTDIMTVAEGRDDPPINIRGDLVAP